MEDRLKGSFTFRGSVPGTGNPPEGNEEKLSLDPGLNLSDIIDVSSIQAVFDDLNSIMNMVTALLDLEGTVLVAAGWQDICMMHRSNPAASENCRESDLFLAGDLSPGEYVGYRCRNGLWDVITPFYIGEHHLGNVYAGQFFLSRDEADRDAFSKQAEDFGLDRERYLAALKKVPVYQKPEVENLIRYLIRLTDFIAKTAYSQLLMKQNAAREREIAQELQKNEALWKTMFNSIPDLAWLKDVNGVYLACNTVFEKAFNTTEESLLGKTDGDFFDELTAEHYRKYDLKVIETGRQIIFEEAIPFSLDRRREVLETIKTPVYGPDGRMLGVLGIGRDITLRKDKEVELKESERLLNEVGRIAKVGGWEMDLVNRSAKWTRAVYDIVEIEYGQPVPGPDEHVDYYLPEYRELVAQAMRRLIEEDVPLYFEAELKTERGNTKWCRAMGRAFRENGQCIKVLGTFQDITEMKRAEMEIHDLNRSLELRVRKRTMELAEASRELEDFVYSVSHDLRAPLRSISGFAEIIGRRYKSSLNDEGRHYFENIVKASAQMSVLIDDLLQFSRLGRKAVRSVPVDLKEVIRDSMGTLADMINSSRAVVNLPDNCPSITGDPVLLTKAVINLLENALKYTRPDTPPVIDITVQGGEDHVSIRVSDNGIGIEPEYQEKIFNIFQRLHGQGEYPGTGIGLASARKAVSMLQGTISVESIPGEGSAFTINLPAERNMK